MKFDEHGASFWPPLPSQTAPPTSDETIGPVIFDNGKAGTFVPAS